MGMLNWLTSPLAAAFGWGKNNKKKEDPYAALLAQLNPLIQSQTKIAEQESASGLAHTKTAGENYDYVTKYLKGLFEGSDDELLKLLNSSEATAGMDENFQQLSELGVRGGARAANLGQASFNKDAALSKLLSQLRFSAPDKIAQIAQGIGNLGLGELGSSTTASNAATNTIFGIEQLKDADADRRAAIISSIFSAIGGAAGAATAMCVAVGDSFIDTPAGKVPLNKIEVGSNVLSFDKETGEQVIRTVIRIRTDDNRRVKVLGFGSRRIRPTESHVFYSTQNFDELSCNGLADDDLLLVMANRNRTAFLRAIKIYGEDVTDVMIIKLDDEEDSYPFICNDFICSDDDCLKV